MKKITAIIILGALLVLAGCATPYQKAGFFSLMGGYSQESVQGKLIKVEFSGNAFLSHIKIKQYVLFRSAQIGKEKGKPYFAMYSSLTNAIKNNKTAEPTVYRTLQKPSSYVYVEYHNKRQPGDLSANKIYNRYKKHFLGR